MEATAPSTEDQKILDMLTIALQQKADNIAHYEQLEQMAIDAHDKEILRKIRADEQKHYNMLADIYNKMTGYMPNPKKGQTKPENANRLADAYENAMYDKLDDIKSLRKILLSFLNVGTRDMLYEIITDEQNNAILLEHLYARARA